MTTAGPTPRRRAAVAAVVAAALAALMALLTTSLTAAAVLPTAWTITATPLTLTQGQASDVTLTVTGGTDRIRCLLVSVPADYEVLDASVVSVPPGETWNAHASGGGPTSVTFSLGSGGGGIQLLQVADFRVQVMPMTTAGTAWTATAHSGKSCTSSPDDGPPLLPLLPFVIIPGPTPTPTSTATVPPTPTPTPTSTATAPPTPTPTVSPTPDPTATPTPRPTPTGARSPSPTSSPSADPHPRSVPVRDRHGVGLAGRHGVPQWVAAARRRAGRSRLRVEWRRILVGPGSFGRRPACGDGGRTVDVGSTDALGYAWLVPGALLGLPGLLLFVIIGAQAVLAGAFVPLTGRALADPDGAAEA